MCSKILWPPLQQQVVSPAHIIKGTLHHFYDHCMNDVPLLCKNDEFHNTKPAEQRFLANK